MGRLINISKSVFPKLLAVFILIIVIMFFGKTTVLLFLVITIIILFILNLDQIKKTIKGFITSWKDIKSLKYYYITDITKHKDFEMRNKLWSDFNNFFGLAQFIMTICLVAMFIILIELVGNHNLLQIFFTICLAASMMPLIIGKMYKFLYNYTFIMHYIIIPVFSIIVIYIFNEGFKISMPFSILSAVGIVLVIYILLVIYMPLHILRKLNSITKYITPIITTLFVIINVLIPFYLTNYSSDNQIGIEDIKSNENISQDLKDIIIDNTEIIEYINYIRNENITYAFIININIIIAAVSSFYIITGIIIKRQTDKKAKKSEKILREILTNPNKMTYDNIIKCAYYGGASVENLMLTNEKMLEVIMLNEKDIVIEVKTLKSRFIKGVYKYLHVEMIIQVFSNIKKNIYYIYKLKDE